MARYLSMQECDTTCGYEAARPKGGLGRGDALFGAMAAANPVLLTPAECPHMPPSALVPESARSEDCGAWLAGAAG